jgi:hypothetical protein
MQFCTMEKLNFPDFNFLFKSKENITFIFDPIRKKWLVLTPEERVRQHCIQFLLKIKMFHWGLFRLRKN